MCQLFSMTSLAVAIAAPMMIIGILSIAWHLLRPLLHPGPGHTVFSVSPVLYCAPGTFTVLWNIIHIQYIQWSLTANFIDVQHKCPAVLFLVRTPEPASVPYSGPETCPAIISCQYAMEYCTVPAASAHIRAGGFRVMAGGCPHTAGPERLLLIYRSIVINPVSNSVPANASDNFYKIRRGDSL